MARFCRSDNHLLLAMLRHPIRCHILGRLADGEARGPGELAEWLAQPLSHVEYHFRVLAKSGALKAVGKHLYQWSLDPNWTRSLLAEIAEEWPHEAS